MEQMGLAAESDLYSNREPPPPSCYILLKGA